MADASQTPQSASVQVARRDEDRFSVVVDHLRATTPDGALAAPAAGRVAEAVDYLGERLRVVEAAPDEALVRSAAPVPAAGGREYYELRFQGDGVTLERRRAEGDGVARVPFVLPKPTLARLVGDLGRLIGPEPVPAPTGPLPGYDGDLFAGHPGCC